MSTACPWHYKSNLQILEHYHTYKLFTNLYNMWFITIQCFGVVLIGRVLAETTCPYDHQKCLTPGQMLCCNYAGSQYTRYVTCTNTMVLVYSPCGDGTSCTDDSGELVCAWGIVFSNEEEGPEQIWIWEGKAFSLSIFVSYSLANWYITFTQNANNSRSIESSAAEFTNYRPPEIVTWSVERFAARSKIGKVDYDDFTSYYSSLWR